MIKRLLTIGVLFAIFCLATAQTPQVYPGYRQTNVSYLVGGEHTPLIYEGTVALAAGHGASGTSYWMQIGWTPYSITANPAYEANPENFTLLLKLTTVASDTDTVGLGLARFETAFDTSDANPIRSIWNADSTNLFIADGNYNHSLYGQWMFEDYAKARQSVSGIGTRWCSFPLRVFNGAYIRFVFTKPSGGVVQANTVNFILVCEN